MKYLKRGYYYIYYVFYKVVKGAPASYWAEWKASLSMNVLIFFTLNTLLLAYIYFIDRNYDPPTDVSLYFLIGIIVFSLNHYLFNHRDKWRKIVSEFENDKKFDTHVRRAFVIAVALCITFLMFYMQ